MTIHKREPRCSQDRFSWEGLVLGAVVSAMVWLPIWLWFFE